MSLDSGKKAPVAPAVPQVFHLELRLEAYDGDGEPFADKYFTILEGKTVLADGMTTADGIVKADLPGDFEYAILRLEGNVGYMEIPLRRWPLPPAPSGPPGPASPSSEAPNEDFPEGTILMPGGAEAAGAGSPQQPGTKSAEPPKEQRGIPWDVEDEALWHELGVRLSNLGYLNRKYQVRWPASGWERILVKTGVLNYCQRHGLSFPEACNWNSKVKLDAKDPSVKAILDALKKEQGEKVP